MFALAGRRLTGNVGRTKMKIPLIVADYNGGFFPLFIGAPSLIVAVIFLFLATERKAQLRKREARTFLILGSLAAILSFSAFYFGKKYGP